MKIEWEKDEEELLYELYLYDDNNDRQQIAYIYWNEFQTAWYLHYIEFYVFASKEVHKYDMYGKDEDNEVLFRATLDIQQDMAEVFYLYSNYLDVFSVYITDYIRNLK